MAPGAGTRPDGLAQFSSASILSPRLLLLLRGRLVAAVRALVCYSKSVLSVIYGALLSSVISHFCSNLQWGD